ncbi:MAG: hypothetical protein ACR2P5_04440 [Gammaproteobacteria bacterium]
MAKKQVRIFLGIIGISLMTVGWLTVEAGQAYSNGANLRQATEPVGQFGQTIAGITRDALRELPEMAFLNVAEKGLTYPLGGLGGLVMFIGLICLLNAIFRFRENPLEYVRKEESTTISGDMIGGLQTPVAVAPQVEIAEGAESGEGGEFGENADGGKESGEKSADGGGIAIDESALGVSEEDKTSALLRDINHLVKLSQSGVGEEMSVKVVKMFRPELSPFLGSFTPDSLEKLAHQMIDYVVLRHHRGREGITADQFQAQDIRMTECERATFARRYLPPKAKVVSDEVREAVGKVYDLQGQSVMQKKFSGEADDWADISLRNAKDILAQKTALEEAA